MQNTHVSYQINRKPRLELPESYGCFFFYILYIVATPQPLKQQNPLNYLKPITAKVEYLTLIFDAARLAASTS